MGNLLRTTAFVLAFAASTGLSALADDAAGMGTWKLNPAKTRYNPGTPPANFTARFEPAGKAVKVTMENRTGDGKTHVAEYTGGYDGKAVPMKGIPHVDSTKLRRLDPYTTERVDMKDGKVVQTLVRKVAKDGKSFTVSVKGVDAKGQPIDHMVHFDKQ
jgi:hypothetical protein